ncbi:HpaI protein [Xanthomonas cissicola]|nr:HpaI protein [Xanthomonas cissicola]
MLESHNRKSANTAFLIGLSACLRLPGKLAQRLGEGETILGPAGMLS